MIPHGFTVRQSDGVPNLTRSCGVISRMLFSGTPGRTLHTEVGMSILGWLFCAVRACEPCLVAENLALPHTPCRSKAWMKQIARNLTDPFDDGIRAVNGETSAVA